MDIEEIMKSIEEKHTWTSQKGSGPALEPCVFCGGAARVIVRYPVFGLTGAWVRCHSCGACGPMASICAMIVTDSLFSTPVLPESLERGITAAVDAWNSRTVNRSRMGNLRLKELPERSGKVHTTQRRNWRPLPLPADAIT